MSDEIFVQRASEFIIAQNLSGRSHINYKRLSMSVEADVLKTFIQNIIDNISVMDGRIQSIVFKNGLSQNPHLVSCWTSARLQKYDFNANI